MPYSRIPLPHPVQPLHVYRHLLRAASYFPATIRPFLDQRIRAGFRKERQRAAESQAKLRRASDPAQARRDEEYRRKKHLLDAKKKIPFLHASANGDQKRLRTLMFHVFARLGKQRRELMSLFVAKDPEPPLGPDQLQERMDQMERDRKKREKLLKTHPWKRNYDRQDPTPWAYQQLSPIQDNWDIPKLRAYIKAQKTHQNSVSSIGFPRGPIRLTDPNNKLPKEDIWGRPAPPRRVTKAVRKWWKFTADRVMPPIDRGSWDFLKMLASGDAPKEMYRFPPKRRIAAPAGQEHRARPDWDWTIHTRLPARDVERPRSPLLTRLTGQWDDGPYSRTIARVPFAKHQPKNAGGPPFRRQPFRTRQIRREYERMWLASAYMETPAAEKESKPTVAKPVWGAKKAELPVATAAHQRLFRGVDTTGKRLKPTTRDRETKEASSRRAKELKGAS
ncbi:hypothetical protein CGRA01v4_12333 [Colletotrichum graminicola]|uniref:Complex 1 LYR protein domain-containing protein n=1 Tax=Colletotrichum graminicola (strain M1.001 / M2 / FGSC 10212) TaxID=645133 RepID=E3QSE8_COLGM|nr:uncharacterized protein GLRG_08919 [Colletotrichum graminicola M1.001]EFQ33775.1 hypothetical protein GLRG_08919 [Colletotrichum graminicola M1.001]WDK21044.1 hypothetical protein CGRA01v4_12333 [Colletotrichum graminicola]